MATDFIGLVVFAQIPAPPWLYVCSMYYISIWGNVLIRPGRRKGLDRFKAPGLMLSGITCNTNHRF